MWEQDGEHQGLKEMAPFSRAAVQLCSDRSKSLAEKNRREQHNHPLTQRGPGSEGVLLQASSKESDSF